MTHARRAAAAALALLAACGDAPPPDRPADGHLPPLPARVVHAAGLGAPTALAVAGPYLLVLDEYADSAITVLRLADGGVVRRYGPKGEGPGEFRAPWRVEPAVGPGHPFWVYDLQLSRWTRFRADQPADSFRVVTLAEPMPLTAPMWLGDTIAFSPGYFVRSGRMAVTDAEGRLVRMAGETPPGVAAEPIQMRQQAYQSTASAQPGLGRIVLANRHADRLEIYDLAGAQVAVATGPERFTPRYCVARHARVPVFAATEEMRLGYVDVASTPERIYALYSGRRMLSGPAAAFGDRVHVFDWSGVLRDSVRLSEDVIGLAVDSAGRTLYATRIDPEPAVLAFDLPRAAAAPR